MLVTLLALLPAPVISLRVSTWDRRSFALGATTALISPRAVRCYDQLPSETPDFKALEKKREQRSALAEKNKQRLRPYLDAFSSVTDAESFVSACDKLSLWLIGENGLPEGLDAPAIRDARCTS